MVVLGQSGCIWAKVVVIRQTGCIRKRWLYSGKVVIFGKSGNVMAKVVVF